MHKIQFRSSFKDCSGEMLLYFVHCSNLKGYAGFIMTSNVFGNKFIDISSNIATSLLELLTNSQEFCVNISVYIFMYIYNHLSMYLSMYVCIYLSLHLPIFLLIYLLIG